MLVGNNVVLVIYGILIAQLFDNTIFRGCTAGFTVPADTILSTLIMLFTGEFLPKSLFKSIPNTMLTVFSPIAYVFYIILWPISKFATFLSKAILRIFGVRMPKEEGDEGFTKVDLDYLIHTSIDNAPNEDAVDDEVKIFQNALDFPDLKVRDCMIPRTEINAVNMETCSLEELKQKFVESGNSKIIVYREDIDHIVGYIHSHEMFRDPKRWQDHIRTLPFVPETMLAQNSCASSCNRRKASVWSSTSSEVPADWCRWRISWRRSLAISRMSTILITTSPRKSTNMTICSQPDSKSTKSTKNSDWNCQRVTNI